MTEEGGRSGLSRRQILGAATTTGALGAVGSGRTGALFTDSTEFPDDRVVAGSLDLEVCWETDDGETCPDPAGNTLSLDIDGLTPGDAGSGLIRLRLPARADADPAWLWTRSRCPSDPCGIGHALKLDLWYDLDRDGRQGSNDPPLAIDGTTLTDISLCRARKLLAKGLRLDARPTTDTATPLQPGREYCIGVSWHVTARYCPPSSASLPFEFRAIQRRHNPEPTRPWSPADCGLTCGAECPDECYPASFVAFCLNRRGDIAKYDTTHLSWTPRTVTFELERAIDTVVLYDGQPSFERFDGPFSAGERYTIERGGGTVLDATTAEEEYGMRQQDPCPELVEDADACGIRYNFEEDADNHWDCVCGPPGPDRTCGGDDG